MNEFDVTGDVTEIDFAATGTAEILQNVRTLLATPEFACPMARDFAWNPDVDAPIHVAQATLTARLVAALREYEPRAEVVRVTFQGDAQNGKLKPIVRIRIVEGGEAS
ncbi:GPW/gp25 family protein [Brevibacillus sp. H7]|uniref:GPW/gp25 family protein n=1 Tax=Brevibacillus sp. H7 TaxID=3349138 RepID=UPI0037F1E756